MTCTVIHSLAELVGKTKNKTLLDLGFVLGFTVKPLWACVFLWEQFLLKNNYILNQGNLLLKITPISFNQISIYWKRLLFFLILSGLEGVCVLLCCHGYPQTSGLKGSSCFSLVGSWEFRCYSRPCSLLRICLVMLGCPHLILDVPHSDWCWVFPHRILIVLHSDFLGSPSLSISVRGSSLIFHLNSFRHSLFLLPEYSSFFWFVIIFSFGAHSGILSLPQTIRRLILAFFKHMHVSVIFVFHVQYSWFYIITQLCVSCFPCDLSAWLWTCSVAHQPCLSFSVHCHLHGHIGGEFS